MSLREELAEEIDEHMLFADDFDAALIGYVEQYGRPPIALYDKQRCLDILMDQGMTDIEAVEFFEFNVIGAWVGDYTPAFATFP